MLTKIYHQLLPLGILLVAIFVWSAVRAIIRPHKSEPGHWSLYVNPDDESSGEGRPDYPDEGALGITGGLSGKVVDERDTPVHAIDVTLVPIGETAAEVDESGEQLEEWTNKDGVFEFFRLKPGEYILGVGARGAPTGERPFMASYYPGTEHKKFSEPVRVQGNLKIELRPLRLRRLQTATIKIHVRWQDGTPVERSNLLFSNPSFPQAVIGGTAPEITNGEGEFVVPLGFDYYARAGVWCKGEGQIDMRESRPVQHLRIDQTHIPQELTFVLQSQPCKFWTPRR
ncbi:MAG TPA: carboxypeptidase-like regulatory domain-containing protein [Candidatus Angelobacter sp.]|nr:carboxypeptidase-like regulatory domain-containing protein [Candidatus Angelobacter sp.]